MIILGIESSCDETGVAIVKDGTTLLANSLASSADLQKVYGGVVPEIAARSHIEAIIPTVENALDQFAKNYPNVSREQIWDHIDGIAVTYGAGLSGSLLIGVLTARTLAITKNKPLYAINHVEAHVYANFLTNLDSHGNLVLNVLDSSELKPILSDGKVFVDTLTAEKSVLSAQDSSDRQGFPRESRSSLPQFPILALIVSGGHTQLVLFKNHFDYILLGQTYDDAIGEAFDKVAKILGLPYPGGPSVEAYAKDGNPLAYPLPIAKVDGDYNFSFSGPKTAVLRAAQAAVGADYHLPSTALPERLTKAQKHDIAASFQQTALQTVISKTLKAYKKLKPKTVVIAGGVAASQKLRDMLKEQMPIDITYAPKNLCTDNGAMVATLGCYMAMQGAKQADPYTLAIQPNLSM